MSLSVDIFIINPCPYRNVLRYLEEYWPSITGWCITRYIYIHIYIYINIDIYIYRVSVEIF